MSSVDGRGEKTCERPRTKLLPTLSVVDRDVHTAAFPIRAGNATRGVLRVVLRLVGRR